MNQNEEVKALAQLGLEKMKADSLHNFDWRIRREIYRKLVTIDQALDTLHFSKLTLKGAEYVLPIAETAFPEDSLPKSLFYAAKNLVFGVLERGDPSLIEIEDEGYLSTGIDNLTWRKTINYSAEYAGGACYTALVEVKRRQSLLENIEDKHGQYNRFLLSHLSQPKAEVFDADFAHLAAFGDTAGAAAIAFACSQEKFDLDRAKLKAFWTWWVNHAIFSIF